jgi:fatty acid/phospholipid biosynthesis enzyme
MELNEIAIKKLATVTGVNLNGAPTTETTLFTVPPSKTAIITHVVIRSLSASAASAVITLGITGGACNEFLGSQTLTNLNGTTKAAILQPVPNATPVAQTLITAGNSFGVEIGTAHGSAVTATFDVFGYLY